MDRKRLKEKLRWYLIEVYDNVLSAENGLEEIMTEIDKELPPNH